MKKEKKKFYAWLDEQIEIYEEYMKTVFSLQSRMAPFKHEFKSVRNISLLQDDDRRIQFSGLTELAETLDIALKKDPFDTIPGGRNCLSYKGYIFFDMYD